MIWCLMKRQRRCCAYTHRHKRRQKKEQNVNVGMNGKQQLHKTRHYQLAEYISVEVQEQYTNRTERRKKPGYAFNTQKCINLFIYLLFFFVPFFDSVFHRFQLNYLILKIYFNLKLCKLNGLNKIGIIRQ